MREGAYVRSDGRKSTQVLRDCEALIASYGGSLRRLHDCARDPRDLEDKLLTFYGVGPVTVNIFLRELRPSGPRRLPILSRQLIESQKKLALISRATIESLFLRGLRLDLSGSGARIQPSNP